MDRGNDLLQTLPTENVIIIIQMLSLEDLYNLLHALDSDHQHFGTVWENCQQYKWKQIHMGRDVPHFYYLFERPFLKTLLEKSKCVLINIQSYLDCRWLGEEFDIEKYFKNARHLRYDFNLNEFFGVQQLGSYFSIKCLGRESDQLRVIQLPSLFFKIGFLHYVEREHGCRRINACQTCKLALEENASYQYESSVQINLNGVESTYIVVQSKEFPDDSRRQKVLFAVVNLDSQGQWTSPFYIDAVSPELDVAGNMYNPGSIQAEVICRGGEVLVQIHYTKWLIPERRLEPKLVRRNSTLWFRE